MVTGPETGTYVTFGKDIANVMESRDQLVTVKPSSGSIDNIRQLVDRNGTVSLGIVQSDILGFMKRSDSDNTKKVSNSLSLLFPFYDEEVHILARTSINGLRDLQDKRIVVGEEGSGNMLTAINLMALSEITTDHLLYMPPAEGVVAVLSGDADAMIFVGGKPVTLFSNLSALKTSKDRKKAALLDQVHFVPVDDQRIFTEYSPTRINSKDYSFVKKTILTAKVSALLVARNDVNNDADSDYCKQLQNISLGIEASLSKLQSDGHPKWNEVNLYESISLWPRHRCVWDEQRFIPGNDSNKKEALTQDLLDIVRHGSKKP